MKKIIAKNKKSFIVSLILILSLVAYLGYVEVKKNFDKIVDKSLKYFVADISHTSADFSKFGEIAVKDAVLKDKRGVTIVYAPTLILKYTIRDLWDGKITEISADHPYVYIALDKNRDVNIVDVFAGSDEDTDESANTESKDTESQKISKETVDDNTIATKEKTKEEIQEELEDKAGVGVPIKIITATNARVLYQDNYYDDPVNMFVNDVEGYVSFDDEDGIDLKFYNTKGDTKVQYSFNNYVKDYSMNISIKNGDVTQNIMQYAYVDEYTNYLGGKVDLDLTIDSDGLWGTAGLHNARFKTEVYDDIATNINGDVQFLGDRIHLKLDGLMSGKKIGYSLEYRPNGIDMFITSKELNRDDLKKVTLFDKTIKQKLDDLGNFNIKYLKLQLSFDENFDMTLNNYANVDKIVIDKTKLTNLEGNVELKGDEVKLKNLRFDADYNGNKIYTVLNGNYDKDILDLNFNVVNRKSFINIKELKGKIKYNLTNDKIDYTLYSNLLKVGGNLDLHKSILGITSIGSKDIEVKYKNKKYSTKNNVKIIYDYKNKNLLYGKGDIDIREKNSPEYLKLDFDSIGNDINITKLEVNYDKLDLNASGNLDIKDLSYDFKYQGKNLKVENYLKRYVDLDLKDLKTSVDFDGTIKGKKDKFSLLADINSNKGSYYLGYKRINGRLSVINNEKLSADFDGYAKELEYKGINFKDFKVGLDYKNNIFTIRELRNNLLTIDGDYNIINETLDFSYKIRGVKENKVKILQDYGIKMDLANVDGKIEGNIDDFKSELYSKEAWIQYKDLPKIYLKGGIHYLDERVYFEGFKLEENNLSGSYDLSKKEFELKANLLENNLPEYYKDVNLKYRLTGEILLWGTSKNISGIFHTYADNVYFRGEKLPNIKMISTYRGGNLENIGRSGHIDINDIKINNDDGEELLKGKGWLDLKEQNLSFKVQDIIDIEKLKQYSNTKNISGKIDAKVNVYGKFDGLKYDSQVKSKVINIEGNDLDDLNIDLVGDLNQITLNDLSLSYHDNRLTSNGNLVFKDYDYNLNIKSNEIDLSFLNVFSFSKYINQIKGIATIDVEVNSKSNYGEFEIKDFSGKMPKYGFEINKVNTKVILDKKLFKIKYFDGKLNNGNIKMDGYLNIPSLNKIKEEGNQLFDLDYLLNLNLDKVDYQYENDIKLVLSSNAKFTKNKVTGNFIINGGEITGIPDIDDNVKVSDIASQIKEKEVIKKSKELGKNFEIKTIVDKPQNIDVDINLITEEPIKLKIKKIKQTSIVEDIFGDLKLNGNLKLIDEELSYNGLISVDNGSVKLNSNQFYLSTATAKFVKGRKEGSELHPTLTLNANSTIANEEVYINISGDYPDLEIQMSSGSGLSSDEIGSLLTFHNVSTESNSNAVVKDVIDREVSGRLFSPISSEIAKVLRIEKFQISSDLVAYEYEGGVYRDTGSLGLGASVEAENPIYKDKVYWKAKARWGTSKYYNNVTEYDFALEHKITKNLSWGPGVGKVPEGRRTRGDTLINYHVDLSWRKKYKNIKQIFLNMLFLGGEE